jgi:hypothetical protein
VTVLRRAGSPLALIALIGAGCGSAAHLGPSHATAPSPLSLATSVATPAGTWAVVVMGGSAARHNNFWQLLARPAGTPEWRLVTPPGVASNGGLVAAPAGGGSLVAAFLPSQQLAFSPLAATSNGGATWSAGLLDTRLASLPGALAASPRGGRLLALLANGTVESSTAGAARWSRLVTPASLARSAGGQRCGHERPTAVSFSPSGQPLLAVACSRPGTAGIFALTGGAWRLAGPALPSTLATRLVTVIGLSVTPSGETALLEAGTGPGALLVAAWSGGGGRWALSPALPLGGALVRSFSAGPGGALAVMLNGRAGVTLTPASSSWLWLPFLPAGSQTVAVGPGGRVDALAAAGTKFTDWAWTGGSSGWAQVATVRVPIQYGSSG